MTSPPLFSILIPTKDRPDLLRRALASAIGQNGPPFEIIVADDGDGAGVAAALALAAPVPIMAFSTGHAGQAPARNLAAARARGRYIAFLDDDDWWAGPAYLAGMAAALADGADFAYAAGRIVQEDSAGEEIAFEARIDAASIRRDNMLLVSGIAYRRALHDELGPFDESFKIYWDWDFYLRVVTAGGRFAEATGDLVRISARAGTASSAAQLRLRQEELDRLAAKHGLAGLALRNHESIAQDQETERRAGR